MNRRDKNKLLSLLRPNTATGVEQLLRQVELACESYRQAIEYYSKAIARPALLTRLSILAAELKKALEEIDEACAIHLERNSWLVRPEGEELKNRLLDLDRACRRRGRPVAKAEEFFIEDLVHVWRKALEENFRHVPTITDATKNLESFTHL